MKCKVEGCDKDVRYIGLCGMHYKRQWRHGDVNHSTPKNIPVNLEKCLAPDCEERGAIKGYCNLHYGRMRYYGRTHSIVNRGSGYTIDTQGYVVLFINGERRLEHIVKAEKALGRKLPRGAVVHHMNKIPHDNDTPLNLVICPDQAYHLLLHRRMRALGYENN